MDTNTKAYIHIGGGRYVNLGGGGGGAGRKSVITGGSGGGGGGGGLSIGQIREKGGGGPPCDWPNGEGSGGSGLHIHYKAFPALSSSGESKNEVMSGQVFSFGGGGR